MMSTQESDEDGDEPTQEEIAEMRLASASDAQAVDELILSKCTSSWRKVAMIVGSSLNEFDEKFGHLPYVYMPTRMLELERAGKIKVQGNVFAMRASEVRLSIKLN